MTTFTGKIYTQDQFTDLTISIGSGAFGDVYKVTKTGTTKLYVVKTPFGEDSEQIRKLFIDEITVLSKLKYPTILKLSGITIGYPYYIIYI